MCGITGILGDRGTSAEALAANMAAAISHRGPDDSGVWAEHSAGIAFGHARLAVIDTSQSGRQPMVSANGRWVIIYNGEVYNAHELKHELELSNTVFRGRSDTEVILEAVSAWGIDAAVRRLIGMFAMALWDRTERTLYLVRDRLGIKPLYWGRFGGLFLFGSELKALRAHPGWKPEISRDALTAFLRYNYVPAPHSIYQGVYKLSPGHILTLRQGQEPELKCYWDMHSVAMNGLSEPDTGDDSTAIDSLEHLLGDAVQQRMIADVPLGALLSGGVDSSLIVSLMQSRSRTAVKTFSIGFHEQGYDEAGHAKNVAEYLGTDHTELYVDPAHAMEILPRLCEWYDEPFADSSQIPTFLISELTRKHVTVALSGDGGDELFAGYSRYLWARALWDRARYLPLPLRRTVSHAIQSLSPATWDRLVHMAPERWRPTHGGDKAYKFAAMLSANSNDDVYRQLVSQWQRPEELVIGGREPFTPVWDESLQGDFPDFTDRMQYMDSVTYLPDDILTKVDRASMAVSLEVRVPLLDHRLVEFAWRQPQDRKIRGGQGKWLLRQVLKRHLPEALIDRPKMGFGVPIDAWLRGPLREWAEELLDERRIRDAGILNPEPIRQKWQAHLSGKENWQHQLWGVLMFQAWYERWG